MKKRILLLPVIALALLAPLIIMTGCFGGYSVGGNTPTVEELTGRWELTETRHRGAIGGPIFATTHRPGATAWPGWTGGYFIEFGADGTFSEQNFWNFDLSTLTGTFVLDGRDLTLTTSGRRGDWVFVGDRRIGISRDGNTLTMVYRREQLGTWNYRHTFERV